MEHRLHVRRYVSVASKVRLKSFSEMRVGRDVALDFEAEVSGCRYWVSRCSRVSILEAAISFVEVESGLELKLF